MKFQTSIALFLPLLFAPVCFGQADSIVQAVPTKQASVATEAESTSQANQAVLTNQTSDSTFPAPSISAATKQPGWYPYVFARGNDRLVIQNTPMHERPYRPMHFYGNTVRRNYHRGNQPQPWNFSRAATSLIRRR